MVMQEPTWQTKPNLTYLQNTFLNTCVRNLTGWQKFLKNAENSCDQDGA